MTINFANSPSYMRRTQKLLDSLNFNEALSFNQARKIVFNSQELQQLILQNVRQPIVALSSGTSQALAFSGYLEQIIQDFKQDRYYREYAPTAGNLIARKALALTENQRLKNKNYDPDDICLTEGSTGAITAVIETLKRNDPTAEVLIASPAYYIYKLASEYFDIQYKEVNLLPQNGITLDFPLKELAKNITQKTKFIVVCNPSNPGGELYNQEDIVFLLQIAKDKNIVIMADELFAELAFDSSKYISFNSVADQIGALDNLVTIKGFSKSKNLAGLRIGYALSKNKQLMRLLLKSLEQRQCFPVASVFTGLICLDAFIQIVRQRLNSNKKNLQAIVAQAKLEFDFCPAIESKSEVELEKIFIDYSTYFTRQLSSYKDLYIKALQEMSDFVSARTETESAFNTFVKLEKLQEVNQFDFTVNLYVQTGLKIEIGPCFGWNQQIWEQDPKLGFWLRLSFSQDKKEFLRGIKQLKKFIPYYLNNGKNLIKTHWQEQAIITLCPKIHSSMPSALLVDLFVKTMGFFALFTGAVLALLYLRVF